MNPHGTVQLLCYVSRSTRDLARAQAAAKGQKISRWIERAVRDLAAAERADAGRLFATVNKEGKATT